MGILKDDGLWQTRHWHVAYRATMPDGQVAVRHSPVHRAYTTQGQAEWYSAADQVLSQLAVECHKAACGLSWQRQAAQAAQ